MIKKTFFKTIALCVAMAIVLTIISLSTKPTFRTVSADLGDNVFGHAWSDNIGWIKMNSCDSDLSGNATNCPLYNNFGVNINATTGAVSGYAWSSNVGWISFGSNNTSGVGGGTNASMTMNSGGTIGTFSGWARVFSGVAGSGGFDGWIRLASDSSDGIQNYYPSGNTNGTQGVTYNKSTGKIVGYAWGGDVIGWIQFGGTNTDGTVSTANVTYGIATPVAFTFNLAVTGSFTIPSPPIAATYTTPNANVVIAGDNPKTVTLAIVSVTGPASAGTANFVVSLSSPATCTATCNKTISVSTTASTIPGTYVITVSASAPLETTKTDTFTVTVQSNFVGACTTESLAPYYVNKPITRKLNITSGSHPYSVLFTGTNILPPGGQSLTTTTVPTAAGATTYTFVRTYSTTGIKTGTVTVTDNTGNTNPNGCPPVTVFVNPNTNEF